MPKPVDFDPYRAQIRGCACDLCHPLGYVNRPAAQHRADAAALLAALKAGAHVHMSYAERSAVARVEHAARAAAACADGVSERSMAILIRGYASSRDSDVWPYGPAAPMQSAEFVDGLGVGMSAGRHAAAEAARAARVQRAKADRAATVARLITADDRNRCVYFRFTGALCGHHGAPGALAPIVSDWGANVLAPVSA